MYIVDFFAYFIFQLLQIYKYGIILYVILSMLISFDLINYNNKLISIIMDFLFKLTEPILRVIRRFLPNLGSVDFGEDGAARVAKIAWTGPSIGAKMAWTGPSVGAARSSHLCSNAICAV